MLRVHVGSRAKIGNTLETDHLNLEKRHLIPSSGSLNLAAGTKSILATGNSLWELESGNCWVCILAMNEPPESCVWGVLYCLTQQAPSATVTCLLLPQVSSAAAGLWRGWEQTVWHQLLLLSQVGVSAAAAASTILFCCILYGH